MGCLRWLKRGRIPRKGGAGGKPRTCKGLFARITQQLNSTDVPEDDFKVIQSIIPDLLIDARSVDATVEGASKALLAGEVSVVDAKTKALTDDYHKESSPVQAVQDDIAADYLRRAKKVDDLLGTPEGIDGPMVQELKQYRGG